MDEANVKASGPTPPRSTRSPRAAKPTQPATERAPIDTIRQHLLDGFHEGVVITDGRAVVLERNERAAHLLPEVVPGELVGARGLPLTADETEFTWGGRLLQARRVVLGPDRFAWYFSDLTEAAKRADALLAERSRWLFLARAGERLGRSLNLDRVCRTAVELAVPALAAAAVLVLPPERGRSRWWRLRDGVPADNGWAKTSALPSAVREALADHVELRPVLWPARGPLADDWWDGDGGPSDVAVASAPAADGPAGVLILAGAALAGAPGPDPEALRGFLSRLGGAIEAAQLYRSQVQLTATLQQNLVPDDPIDVTGLRWGTAYRPAQSALRIGGDFYGSHRLANGDVLFFLGDVAGKGVDAAVLTGQVRQAVRILSRIDTDPLRLLRLLNDMLLESGRGGRFTTVVLGTARPAPHGLELTLTGGGHLPPLILRADGRVEPVMLGGMLVGVVDEPMFGRQTVRLAPGETCVLYTDGVTEARGGHQEEMYGLARLTAALAGCASMPAPAVAERVEQLATDWLGARDHDDIAVLAVRAVDRAEEAQRRASARHLHAVNGSGQP
jgi:serine phosphatase RsbU (regulator of sigma subunit)